MNRAQLKTLGLEQEQIDAVMAQYGNDVENLNQQLKTFKEERDTAQAALKNFDGVDVEALKKAPQELKKEYEQKLQDLKKDHAIDAAFAGAKVKHGDLLRQKIDRAKLTFDDQGNLQGMEEQMKALKESYADLFTPSLSGKDPSNPESTYGGYDALLRGADSMTAEEVAQILNKGE
uniref:phage scaffolding protein n=1 Tax=Ndongobacter massiliensis TaxID=1871025 RepID=UPI0009310227|nr:phage scaffolding protein [Ndongobacter massiliensis]